MELTIRQLQKLNCTASIRSYNNRPYITDNGNYIIDCNFKKIKRVDKLQLAIDAIPGVVESGLFPKIMVSKVIVGYDNGEVKVINHQ